MADINSYTLSNKIRTILLTTIDKEMLVSSNKNHLLLNSQTQEQLMKKFQDYRDFTIESEELFEGRQDNEDNNIFYDLRYNYSNNKFNFFCHSSRTCCGCLFPQTFITKLFSPKKNNANSKLKKNKNLEKSEDNLCKLKVDSRKKLSKMKSSISCKDVIDFKNLVTLSNDNSEIYMKKFSADLYNYSADNKNHDSTELINYCYNLKKPRDEIINEISDDDTPANIKKKNNHLFSHRIKKNHKNIPQKKLKKIINKKKNIDRNNHNNNDTLLRSPAKNKITNFTNEMKLYFDNLEKSYPKGKLKIPFTEKKLFNNELKEIDNFQYKNIIQLHHYSKSLDKKSKRKKIEQPRKSFCIELMNKKSINKNLLYFKSIDNNHLLLKHKEKKEKREKNDPFIAVNSSSNTQFRKKRLKKSKTLCKNNDEFEQNDNFCYGKKCFKHDLNKKNESTKNERKNIDISNVNYKHKIIYRNYSVKNIKN